MSQIDRNEKLSQHAKKLSVGYNTVALNYTIGDKVPSEIKNEIPNPLPLRIPASLRILRRCTLRLSDTSQNHRLSHIAAEYDIFVIRPTNEASLGQACQSLECDLVSLDLTQRYPFYFKQKPFCAAIQRGVKFEICYAPAILNSDGGASRRNLISNATQLIRATRGRGLVISSEAQKALTCRAPADVVNLAVMWGLGQDRATETVGREARSVVVQAEMKRRSFRGVIDVLKGGEPPAKAAESTKRERKGPVNAKRKADPLEDDALEAIISSKPLSKREQKRQAKKARLETHPPAHAKRNSDVRKERSTVEQTDATKPSANGDPG